MQGQQLQSDDVKDVEINIQEAKTINRIGTMSEVEIKAVTTPSGHDANPLIFTHRFAGGLIDDVKARGPWYLDDWTEAFRADNFNQALASVIFLFFACLSPAVTFGMLFDEYTEGQLGVVETVLSSSISGILYALFSGQPLSILGATGPELAYTAVFFNLCKSNGLEFLPARVWQGLWCALFTVLLAVFDMCALMKYVSRFTEEIFSALISIIFIFEAFLNIGKLYADDDSIEGRARAFSGTILCFGTYGLATMCKGLKATKNLTPVIRTTLANYGVIISIVLWTLINWAFRDVGNAKLHMPDKVEPTWRDPHTNATRSWLVNPMGTDNDFPGWGIAFCALPALGLALLGYMDQNLTSLLINRKDHNLKKPPGYHLDLFVCGAFVYPILAFLGLPFTHAATVRSMTHLISLSTRETVPLEGGGTTTKVIKVIEGRTTQMAIHVLLLLSLTFTPLLRQIPKTVLYGVFLFMGVGSMAGNQLFDRMALWKIWVPSAYPRYDYIKHVSFSALHSFTIFQFAMLAILFTLTRVKAVAVAFPFFIGLLVPIRWSMKWFWSAETIKWLDQ